MNRHPDAAELAAEYKAGATAADLARRYGIRKSVAQRLILQGGGTMRSCGARGRPVAVADLVTAYTSGASLHAVATRFAMSHRRARRLLTEAGVTIRPPNSDMVFRVGLFTGPVARIAAHVGRERRPRAVIQNLLAVLAEEPEIVRNLLDMGSAE